MTVPDWPDVAWDVLREAILENARYPEGDPRRVVNAFQQGLAIVRGRTIAPDGRPAATLIALDGRTREEADDDPELLIDAVRDKGLAELERIINGGQAAA